MPIYGHIYLCICALYFPSGPPETSKHLKHLQHVQDSSEQLSPRAQHKNDDGMPGIPEPAGDGGDPKGAAEGAASLAERQAAWQKAEVDRKARVKQEMEGMQPWASGQSILALDRIRRLLEHLDDAGFLFKSSLRRFLKVRPLCRDC